MDRIVPLRIADWGLRIGDLTADEQMERDGDRSLPITPALPLSVER